MAVPFPGLMIWRLFTIYVCIQADPRVPIEAEELERLNAYAVQVRYPGDDPTLDEAREAVEIAQAVRRWTRAVFRSISREQEL